ncbi:U3 snoRNP protein [Boothiomyces macroporosus]|uniref:U3 snoRNP protein n=1 Tax=Boothiomyces macroporosus TaxID=261099 RepID=A0AAD5Y5L5_9FUNG|nr:U3 snoRNP protein [Boothiomyces macroporosus]
MEVKQLNKHGSNRFKFQSFNDRIKDVKINIHKVQKQEETESFFMSEYDKYLELNLTNEYREYQQQIRSISRSLVEILYHKDQIVEISIQYLDHESCIEPILSLLIALIQDLQSEVYGSIPPVLTKIVSIINYKTPPEILDVIFTSISTIFKYLQTQLTEDLDKIFDIFMPLFRNEKLHIRLFASEAFGFILRKSKQPSSIYQYILGTLDNEMDIDEIPQGEDSEPVKHNVYIESVAMVFFETLKVNQQFYSRSPLIIQALIEVSFKSIQTTKPVLEKLFILIGHFGSKETMTDFWLTIYKILDELIRNEKTQELSVIIDLLTIWTGLRKGTRIANYKELLDRIQLVNDYTLAKYSDKETFSMQNDLVRGGLKLFAVFLLSSPLPETLASKKLLDRVSGVKNTRLSIEFYNFLLDKSYQYFGRLLLPDILRMIQDNWDHDCKSCITFLSCLFEHHEIRTILHTTTHSLIASNGLIKNSVIPGLVIKKLESVHFSNSISEDEIENVGTIYSCLSALSYFEFEFAEYFRIVTSLIIKLLKIIEKGDDSQYDADILQGERMQVLQSLVGHLVTKVGDFSVKTRNVESLKDFLPTVLKMLPKCASNVGYLKGMFSVYEALKPIYPELLDSGCLDSILVTLKSNIASFDSNIRLETMKILALFTAAEVLPTSSYSGPCSVFEICCQLESTPNSIEYEREKPILLRKLETLLTSNCIPPQYLFVIPKFCLAQYSVNFAPLWPQVTQTLVVCANFNSELFWSCFKSCLENVCRAEQPPPLSLQKISAPPLTKIDKRKAPLVSFECTNLNDWNRTWNFVVDSYANLALFNLQVFFNNTLPESPMVDFTNIYTLLIKSLGEMPSVMLAHSNFIVPLFLNIFNQEFDSDEESGTTHARRKISAYLTMFSKQKKPRKMHLHETLYSSFLNLLANGDGKLQQLALDCIYTWQYQGMVKYAEELNGLVSDERLRDTLAAVDITHVKTQLNHDEYEKLVIVVLRILYGKIVSRKGRNSSKTGIKARRTAIFNFLATMHESERIEMMNLMLEPFKLLIGQSEVKEYHVVPDLKLGSISSLKKQIGFLTVLEDFIKQLRTLVQPCLPSIMSTIINLLHYSEELVNLDQDEDFIKTQARQIRLLALKRLTILFSIDVDFDFTVYIPQIFTSVIDSRVDKFEIENTQAPSAVMELIGAWSKHINYVEYLKQFNGGLIRGLIMLLGAKKVQETVVSFVLNIVENIQDLHDEFPERKIVEKLLKGDLAILLEKCEYVLTLNFEDKSSNAKLNRDNISTRIIRLLSRVSSFVESSSVAEKLVNILMPFLKSSVKAVPESTKVEILQIFRHFIPFLPISKPSDTHYYQPISQLFSVLETREARSELLNVFKVFSQKEPELVNAYNHLENLNAQSLKRMDEPDFERRFQSYTQINQHDYKTLDLISWKPLLYNFVFFVKDPEEFSIRTAASFGIKRFIERSVKVQDEGESNNYKNYILRLIFPELKKGIKLPTLVVRQEFIILLGYLVQLHQALPEFQDMVCLLGIQSDDETNFFSNITHLQVHRRLRALRFLAQMAQEHKLSPNNVSNIFVSMVAHFIFESSRTHDHNVINEAVTTIGALCGVLKWGQYYASLKRFMNCFTLKPDLEKVLIRLVIQILDNFHFKMELPKDASEDIISKDEEPKEDGDEDDSSEMEVDQTQDEAEKVHSVVTQKLLPNLQRLLDVKNDETIPIRTPLAISITKLLKLLPQKSLHIHLPKLITTLCNILSSHLQSTRDSCRSTLVTISTMLGPDYLLYIIQGLQTALKRGYQLHVLGYTLHAIMAENVDKFPVESINNCVKPIVEISMHDIFGETGQEREVQELKGKMREIKTTKSYDTLEYLSRLMSFGELKEILLPIKAQMLEANQIKVIRQLEELFRKIALGLNSNPSVNIEEFMVFVHQLLSESLPLAQADIHEKDSTNKHIKVQLKRSDATVTMKYYESNVHLFIEFGLSLLLTSLKRERIVLNDKKHLQLLDPLVNHLGKSLYSKYASITVLAVKIFSLIIKAPLPNLPDTIPVAVKRIFQIIAKSGSTDSELIQQCFKLLTIVLRDCKQVKVPEKPIIALLGLLGPDLEDQNKQSNTFSLIRAILSRKIISNEMYDLMDKVAKVLVVSQSGQVRDLCRSSFMQFLVDYPHGNARMKKLMSYLVSNLEYEFESGRLSVLEFFKTAAVKLSDEVFNEHSDMLLLAIIMSLANDESAKCKEMAADLIKATVIRIGVNKMEKHIELVSKWFGQGQSEMQLISCQLIGILVEAFGEQSKLWLLKWFEHLNDALQICLDDWNENLEAISELDQELDKWEIGYMALKSISKILKVYPTVLFCENGDLWEKIVALMLHPHQWIRLICSQLLGSLFAHISPETRVVTKSSNQQQPHVVLDEEVKLKHLARKFCDQLDSDYVTSQLAKQIVKNLFFIAKTMIPFMDSNEQESEDEEDEHDESQETRKICGLLWLTKRLYYLARADAAKKRGIILRSSVFQWFAAVFNLIPKESSKEYLQLMVTTLYYTEKDETFKGEDADNLKQLASEVMALLQKQAGTTEYLEVYQSVHEKIQNSRREKKQQRNMLAITDPKTSAQMKIKKNEMKMKSRKRKAEEFASKKLKMSKSHRVRH